ncbi:uncharacterized protein PAS_chr2-2_0398 [Komagataella phaffii GS115]|uniref:PH-response regulator protein palI/RIM9 n=2 Tax=Komagataella phaffii TaxID=460519 RepID=C4R1Y7_KOMPG|nr:uncharacterized protein PAS_chr2-2_0398 [Komagataella phaffii GS115]CAY69511.1 Protein, unknown function, involved in proteolytic activation of Rim101p in response to alkaline pH [Komagataella phaffii GS115]
MSKVVVFLNGLLAITFTFELLSVLSVPITKHIQLCSYQGYKFGVFGYCTENNICTTIGIGYHRNSIDELRGFSLPSNARSSISSLLVVHLIGCVCTFILWVLSLMLNMDRFHRSLWFLLTCLVWTCAFFFFTLFSFLVDVLLFVPHVAFGGWLMLVSTVFLAFTGTIFCIMRRTVSSRKTHLKNYNGGSTSLMRLQTYISNSSRGSSVTNDEYVWFQETPLQDLYPPDNPNYDDIYGTTEHELTRLDTISLERPRIGLITNENASGDGGVVSPPQNDSTLLESSGRIRNGPLGDRSEFPNGSTSELSA